MTAILQVANLTKSYGAISVLKDLSFNVVERETLAIVGPNGAGKTTLFRALTGEVAVDAGSIQYRGRDVTDLPLHQRVRAGMGRSFQVARIFPDMSVIANLLAALESRIDAPGGWYSIGSSRATRDEAEARVAEIGLAPKRDWPARSLSHGDKKRLEFALMLALRPHILLLDEPTAGMSPPDRTRTIDLLKRELTQQNLTMLLTEHDMDVVFGLADRIMVLNYGELIALSRPDDIRGDPAVRRVYLGADMDDA